jgi:hypothetical protein
MNQPFVDQRIDFRNRFFIKAVGFLRVAGSDSLTDGLDGCAHA